ncbi:MAG: twin-arginine translocase subunit TatC [Pirellulales bacterium]|nr:twin-arginine translocase subunit TatC [Pirellulales bacterium]
MRRQYDKDLFKDTTMTFGEHLEELRTCLFKSIIGLAIGFSIGLYYGGDVVDFIQTPLKGALSVYYQERSLEEVRKNRELLRNLGYALPEDPDTLEAFLAKAELEDGTKLSQLKFERVYINPTELLRQLKQAVPGQFQNVALPDEGAKESFGKRDLVSVFLWRPIEKEVRVTSLSAHEPFLIYIKGSLLVGAILASPYIFYQIWSFVAAGLYPHERKYIHVFLPFSLALFFLGAALAFFFVFGPVLQFLFHFNAALGIDQDIRISEWLGFVLMLPLGFGVSFQLPLVMLFLERIGIFDVEAYVSKWRIAILVIAVLSMFLTPADPTSMILMAAPLTVLYFGGILLCKYMPRNDSPFDELES